MKLYLAADIEGSCGFSKFSEGFSGDPNYDYFRRQMTQEVTAACRGALRAGADEILIHDAHGTARNIDPAALPKHTQLLRGSVGDPFAMLSGLKETGADAVMLTGFHSGAGTTGNPASHTFNRSTARILLNGSVMSEMLFDVYTAASLGIPTCFISGDEALCEQAKLLLPGVTVVPTVTGMGAASRSPHPEAALAAIEAAAEKAAGGNFTGCLPALPDTFTMQITFREWTDAYFNSFYPGIRQLDPYTLEYTAGSWYEMLVMVHFVLDK